MNKRHRKKWLKKNGLYVNPKDTWNLDSTIAQFVLPRLKLYKKVTNGYPGRDDMDTFEKWITALDKMINAFELLAKDDWLDYYWDVDKQSFQEVKQTLEEKQKEIEEGLKLFAKWFQQLWW